MSTRDDIAPLRVGMRIAESLPGARRIFVLAGLLAAFLPGAVLHAELFQLADQNPFVVIQGLPVPGRAVVPESGQSSWAITYNVSNTLNIESSSQGTMLVDGEMTVLEFNYERGGAGWAWGASLPWLAYGGGGLDGFIHRYHQALGLPQGDRLQQPEGRLAYVVPQDKGAGLNFTQSTSGVGDLKLLLSRQLLQGTQAAVSLHSQVKLPTGDPEKLTGSGGGSLSLWGVGKKSLIPGSGVTMSGYLGYLYLQNGDVLAEQVKTSNIFGGGALGWRYSGQLFFLAQLDFHTGFYRHTGYDFLGNAVLLTLGGGIHFRPDVQLKIAVAEDIKVNASPDVSFHFSLEYRPSLSP